MGTTPNPSGKTNILVTGDFIVDRNILPVNYKLPAPKNYGTRIIDYFGGSLLTYSLLNSLINNDETNNLNCYFNLEEPDLFTFISENPERTAFSTWFNENDKNNWKIKELNGFGNGSQTAKSYSYKRKTLADQAEWIVIDDGNLGFRDDAKAWPDFAKKNVICKHSFPFHEGELLKKMSIPEHKPDTLIFITNLANLRKCDIKISSGISWEQTALDIVCEIKRCKKLTNLLKADHLIVLTGASGAIHFQINEDITCTELNLIFDPYHIEGEWESLFPLIPGTGSCFLAAFSHNLILNFENDNLSKQIENSIKAALLSLRIFCKNGLNINDVEKENYFKLTDPENTILEEKEKTFSKAFIPSPFDSMDNSGNFSKNNHWSILCGNYLTRDPKLNASHFVDLACNLAITGPKTMLFAPEMSFGKITSFDRLETESFRNIKKLMVDYAINKNSTKPLNLVVFGAPGSGKSFAVKEMSKIFLEKFKPSIFEFNLSQFKDATELSGAFHAIRDAVLTGKLPVVFWDEFDSESLKWLKSLLAPMQDGQFQDGKDTHPIGKSIFIFAGGTSETFDKFDPRNIPVKSDEKTQTVENFIKVKGPDFVSRIHGYLNVCGPNPSKDGKDITYPVRRAMFIRIGLGVNIEKLNIDYGLLRALLSVDSYKNGARSLDRILSYLKMSGNKQIVRSDLPSDEVIEMNTPFEQFYKLMNEEILDENSLANNLAPFIHKAWMEKKVTDSSFYKEYYMLSNEQRFDNISAALRIKEVLDASKKFILDDLNSAKVDASAEFLKFIEVKENLELLAKKEHNLWMEVRQKLGWVHGKKRSDYFKIHPCMVEYNKLSEKEKEKDRDTIRKYPEFLNGSMFKIAVK
jgi:hypothetical protein